MYRIISSNTETIYIYIYYKKITSVECVLQNRNTVKPLNISGARNLTGISKCPLLRSKKAQLVYRCWGLKNCPLFGSAHYGGFTEFQLSEF